MITKADEAYLEFQKHVITYSNSQSTVHITGDNYCSPLQDKTQSSCCAFGEPEPLTAVQSPFCKRLFIEPPGRFSIYAYCKVLQKITCILVFPVQLLNARCAICCLCLRQTHNTLFCTWLPFSKLVASNGNGAI